MTMEKNATKVDFDEIKRVNLSKILKAEERDA